MRNYSVIILIFLSLFYFACGNDSTDNSNETNKDSSKTVVKNNNSNNKTDNKVEDSNVKINADFEKFLNNFENIKLPYTFEPEYTEELKVPKIPLKEQIKYLTKPENLEEADFKEMVEYTDFYFFKMPIKNDKFHAIIYARFEMGSTYYILCTYDNEGKYISHIDFAIYQMIGAGPQAGQEFTYKGTLSKDYEVTVTGKDETTKYKINKQGKIEKLK